MSELLRTARVRTSLGVVIATFVAGTCFVAQSQDRRSSPAQYELASSTHTIAELESLFWRCDYAATQAVVDRTTAALCSRATEDLRMAKFNGDFSALLAWWRQHRTAGHRAAQSRTQPAPTGNAPEDETRRKPDSARPHL